ncbi:MAG: type II toxin-antitoxin system Phd/YefM family antitoxin [Clostridia bacterium]|nr:type II toxin-antitoxin system Phd/YefM family antitoxin [Clostridia bacterium]
MSTTNISNFRKNLFELTDNIINYNEPLTVTSKSGNVVVMSEEEYRGIVETIYLSAIPNMEESLLKLKATPTDSDEFVPESGVNWDEL